MHPLIGLTIDGLRHVAKNLGMPAFKATQMARWIYERRADSIDAMTDLSVRERAVLKNAGYTIGREAPIAEQRSSDGTVKYAFPGLMGRPIESVYIPDGDRATLCVSSQVGCRMGCHFCATGKGGFQGQLTATAIINQVLSVPETRSLTNIVFMGMGEPLDNLPALLDAIDILTTKWGLAWSPRRITVSTVGGHIDALRTLLKKTQVNVALSLHTPYAADRAQWMPAERMVPAVLILDELRRYDWHGQRRLSIEYIMWRGINDRPRDASALATLLQGLKGVHINLIPYHDTEGDLKSEIRDLRADSRDDNLKPQISNLRSSSHDTMVNFRDRLNALGIKATIRASRGRDIDAACGQLSGKLKC